MEHTLFCEEHWSELLEKIEKVEINGIALQPLSVEALAAHEDVLEECKDIIGEKDNDFDLVIKKVSPACCYLEGRTRYTEDSEIFDDDYGVLLHMGTLPDEEPSEWWVEK